MHHWRYLLLPAFAGLIPAVGAAEESSVPWTIEGDLSFDYSHYWSNGDPTGSPYPFTGSQYFASFGGTASAELSPYRRFTMRALGLVNQSDYRSPHENLVFEQFSFSYENGESAIPYALDGGDIYASFSPRSLQVPLKGLMIELQPGGDTGDWQHSVSILGGFDQGVYRDITFERSDYAGISWLMDNEAVGSVLLNNVTNYKHADTTTNDRSLTQNVTTAAGATEVQVGSQTLSLEAEVGALYGDIVDPDDATLVANNQFGTGLFTRLEGYSQSPLDYSISFERYDENYSPAGAVITPNESQLESNIGWRFADGLRLSGRHLRVESELESANPTLENTYGARLSGPLLATTFEGLSGTLDGSITNVKDETFTLDNRNYYGGMSLRKILSDAWTARYGFRWRENHNRLDGNVAHSQDHDLAFDYVWTLNDWSGVISPGVAFIESEDNTRYDRQVGPQFQATASTGPHAISASYQFRQIDQKLPVSNIFTESATARYSYTDGPHSVSLYGDYFKRDPDGADTDAYRLGMTYTLNFYVVPDSAGEGTSDAGASDDILVYPQLGMNEASWQASLETEGYGAPNQAGRLKLLDERPFGRVSMRQQVAYRFEGGVLKKHGVIFEPDSENPASLARDYNTLLSEMIRRFGRPTASYENGEFTTALSEEVASGQFRRLHEWNKRGRILRFGIPRRLDNQIRFELVGASDFPSAGNPAWGVE